LEDGILAATAPRIAAGTGARCEPGRPHRML